jgi:hypothetical protein
MKARITEMKAPWPSGAVVGSVVLFSAGAIPAWAAGKCVEAGEDETPTHVVPEASSASGEGLPSMSAEDREKVAQAFHDLREESLRRIQQAQDEFAGIRDDLQAKLQALTGENESLGTALADSRSKLAELEGKLAAAEEGKAAAVKAADDLQAKLTAATSKKK